jgi:hypothetical protein
LNIVSCRLFGCLKYVRSYQYTTPPSVLVPKIKRGTAETRVSFVLVTVRELPVPVIG